MDPHASTGGNRTVADETELDDGYSREELMALLQGGLDSGLSERSWDEIIRDLNVQHFGKEKI